MQRPPAPEELPPQMPVVKEMVRAWGIASFEVPGVEADDVLATLTRRFEEPGLSVTIATSDKDLLQLVSDGVTVYDPWKEKRFGPEDVKEKLGVAPEQVPDLLALSGDDVDNIPGVPGVGPKRGGKYWSAGMIWRQPSRTQPRPQHRFRRRTPNVLVPPGDRRYPAAPRDMLADVLHKIA